MRIRPIINGHLLMFSVSLILLWWQAYHNTTRKYVFLYTFSDCWGPSSPVAITDHRWWKWVGITYLLLRWEKSWSWPQLLIRDHFFTNRCVQTGLIHWGEFKEVFLVLVFFFLPKQDTNQPSYIDLSKDGEEEWTTQRHARGQGWHYFQGLHGLIIVHSWVPSPLACYNMLPTDTHIHTSHTVGEWSQSWHTTHLQRRPTDSLPNLRYQS